MARNLQLALGTAALGLASLVAPSVAHACTGESAIDRTFSSGARWELCWSVDDARGVVLSDVVFTAANGLRRKVLDELALAQAYVARDDGSERAELLTENGLGGTALDALAAGDCGGGALRAAAGVPVLCERIRARGYEYKYYSAQRQGELLELHSVSRTPGRSLTTRWRLYDSGIIEPAVGISESMDSVGGDARYGWDLGGGDIGVGAIAKLYWRIDFDLGGNGANDIVEEFTVTPSGDRRTKALSLSRLTSETGRLLDFDLKRSWRVRDGAIENADGHPVSYHLEPLNHGYAYAGAAGESWASFPFYVTRDAACEQLLTDNSANNTVGGACGDSVTDFTNGESINGADVVFWYGIADYHLPSAEDDPFSDTRWHGFTLVPRDWTAVNPLAVLVRDAERRPS